MSEPTYEESVERLKQVVDLLEQGNLGLDESLRLFEEGMGLSKRCEEKLKAVEEQVRLLVDEAPAGRPQAAGAKVPARRPSPDPDEFDDEGNLLF